MKKIFKFLNIFGIFIFIQNASSMDQNPREPSKEVLINKISLKFDLTLEEKNKVINATVPMTLNTLEELTSIIDNKKNFLEAITGLDLQNIKDSNDEEEKLSEKSPIHELIKKEQKLVNDILVIYRWIKDNEKQNRILEILGKEKTSIKDLGLYLPQHRLNVEGQVIFNNIEKLERIYNEIIGQPISKISQVPIIGLSENSPPQALIQEIKRFREKETQLSLLNKQQFSDIFGEIDSQPLESLTRSELYKKLEQSKQRNKDLSDYIKQTK